MHYLGLDIGGTKIAAVVMDAHGWEIRRYRCPTQKSTYQQFVSCVVALIEQIRRDVQRPMLTGIALPGSISPLTGLIKNANIQVINGHALQADLQQLLGQPVVIANDGNCFALSEACDGAGQDYDVVFGITLGTGCGGGIAIKQRPFIGAWEMLPNAVISRCQAIWSRKMVHQSVAIAANTTAWSRLFPAAVLVNAINR